MKWSYDYKNRLPANHFAYCDAQGICRFPIFDIKGNLDPIHLRNALSRLPITELPDERLRGKIKRELQILLNRMNSGEKIKASEWRPITSAKMFGNPMKEYKYVQKISKIDRSNFNHCLHYGTKPCTLKFNLEEGRAVFLTAMPPQPRKGRTVGYIAGSLCDRGGRVVSHYERINELCGEYHFTDGDTRITLEIR